MSSGTFLCPRSLVPASVGLLLFAACGEAPPFDGFEPEEAMELEVRCDKNPTHPRCAPADAGTPDAGTPDAGMPDAGTPDAGTADAGTPSNRIEAKIRYSVNGTTVTFTSLSTGPIVRQEWDLDATGPTTGVDYVGSSPPPKTFALGTASVPRRYAVKLTVIDADGNRDSVYEPLAFGTQYLGPKAFPSMDVEGLLVRVNGSGSVGSDLTYAWSYGDGTLATGIAPSQKTYAAAGTYPLTLTVTDFQGRTHSQSRPVVLAPRPTWAPGVHNTGVSPSLTLTPVGKGHLVPPGMTLSANGDLYVVGPLPPPDAQGCHYARLEFRAFVQIRVANLTLCHSRFVGRSLTEAEDQNNQSAPRMLLVTHSAATNFQLRDSTFRPAWAATRLDAIGGRNFTLDRVDISGSIDGVKVYTSTAGAPSNVVIRNSYIHDLHYGSVASWFLNRIDANGFYRVEGEHTDAIQHQSGLGTQILDNTLLGATNAGIQVTQDAGPTGGLIIRGNFFDAGGCNINVSQGSQPVMTGMRIQNNVFGRNMTHQPPTRFGISPFPDTSNWGTSLGACGIIYNFGQSDLDDDANVSGNVWQTGGPLTRVPRDGLIRIGG